MNSKKFGILLAIFVLTGSCGNVYSEDNNDGTGLSAMFKARNVIALDYKRAKESFCDGLRGVAVIAGGLGVFNFLRSHDRSKGKLGALSAAVGLASTLYHVLPVFNKWGLNYVAKLRLWPQRREKQKLTKALYDEIDARNITSASHLPDIKEIHTHTEYKMYYKLLDYIHCGGLNADASWAKKMIPSEEPVFWGGNPEEVDEVVARVKNPAVFTKHGCKPARGMFLWGPSGTGKSTLAEKIAYRAKCPFLRRSPAAFARVYVGTGPKALEQAFEEADQAARSLYRAEKEEQEEKELAQCGFFSRIVRRVINKFTRKSSDLFSKFTNSCPTDMKPAILCMDEIDGIGTARDSQSNNNEQSNTQRHLLTLTDKYRGSVYVVATTNTDILQFDDAMKRRFDKMVYVGLPNEEARWEIFKGHILNSKFMSDDIRKDLHRHVTYKDLKEATQEGAVWNKVMPWAAFWKHMVDQTKHFSGANIEQLFEDAKAAAACDESLTSKERKITGALLLKRLPRLQDIACSAVKVNGKPLIREAEFGSDEKVNGKDIKERPKCLTIPGPSWEKVALATPVAPTIPANFLPHAFEGDGAQ